MTEYGGLLGGDPDRPAVIGDSAGGNLAAAVTPMARERRGPDVGYQVPVYPATDYGMNTDSYDGNADVPELPRASIAWCRDHYLERDFDGEHPDAPPHRARSLADLPPATVVTASHDPLRDEGEAHADRLADAGVRVSDTSHGDLVYVFNLFPGLSYTREFRESLVADLRGAFGTD